jgi:predicted nucleic acid-binding protein
VAAWRSTPSLRFLGEGSRHIELLIELAVEGRAAGAKIHDARIAAICLEHGVSELWTADRDFGRFPSLKTRNPLVG